MNDGRRESYLPLIEASLYQKTESRSLNSRSRDGVGAKIEIESLLVKSRLGINGIGLESVIDRIRNAAGNDWDHVWDRLPKSELFTKLKSLIHKGNKYHKTENSYLDGGIRDRRRRSREGKPQREGFDFKKSAPLKDRG
ncbi:hypothetical protein LXL04_007632 [Taraxacum kok-saghyz]